MSRFGNRGLKIGFYRTCITPPVGTPMAGYALRPGPAAGVHDDLYVNALYFSDGAGEYAVASIDALTVDPGLSGEVRRIVGDALGLRPEQVVVAATHTHSGPDLNGIFAEPDPVLRSIVARKIAGAITAAASSATEASLRSAIGLASGVTVNRRNPGSGPLDERVHVAVFRGDRGFKATIVGFTCHPVVLGHNNMLISADYPGPLRKWVEALTGTSSVFLNGTCGDINPLTPTTDLDRVYDRTVGTFDDVEWMGKVVACEAVKQALLAKPEKPCLAYVDSEVELDTLLPQGYEEAKARLEELETRIRTAAEKGDRRAEVEARVEYFRSRMTVALCEAYGGGSIRVRVQALSLGQDTALVFLPSEVLVEIGLRIKSGSPFRNTMVVSYANDYFGYVPPSSEYDCGGYETTYPVSVLKKGEAEKLIKASLSLLEKLKAG